MYITPIRYLGVILCGALIGATTSVTAAAPPTKAPAVSADTQRTVETLLSGYEYAPTADDWRRAGTPAEVAAALIQTATNHPSAIQQSRATSSLAHVAAPGVEAFLETRADTATLSLRLRGKALIAWAYQAKDRVAPKVAAFLTHPDADLREDAVRALTQLSATSVAQFLRDRHSAEPVPHIRDALSAAAAQVDRNRAALTSKRLPVPTVQMPRMLGPVRAAP